MSLAISRLDAKNLTLAFLNDWMNQLPVAQRTAPVIMFDMRSYTLPEMIAQVQTNTDVGVRYTNFYIASLKRYIIV